MVTYFLYFFILKLIFTFFRLDFMSKVIWFCLVQEINSGKNGMRIEIENF